VYVKAESAPPALQLHVERLTVKCLAHGPRELFDFAACVSNPAEHFGLRRFVVVAGRNGISKEPEHGRTIDKPLKGLFNSHIHGDADDATVRCGAKEPKIPEVSDHRIYKSAFGVL
jgi:hypothetical protein